MHLRPLLLNKKAKPLIQKKKPPIKAVNISSRCSFVFLFFIKLFPGLAATIMNNSRLKNVPNINQSILKYIIVLLVCTDLNNLLFKSFKLKYIY